MSAVGEHNLALLAERSQERHGEYDALHFEGRWLTSTEIHDRSLRVAGGLRRIGVVPGDRVIVLMMNTPEVFITYRAIWRAGAVATPVIFLQTEAELRHILTSSGARAVVVSAELLALLTASAEDLDVRPIVVGEADLPPGAVAYTDLEQADPLPLTPRTDADLAALLYTGGTTGRAKGVMLSHRGLWESAKGIDDVARTATSTRSLLPLPLSHAYGLIVSLAAMHSDRRLVSVLQRWFEPRAWLELVQEHRIETSPVVPAMLQMLLAEPYQDFDLDSLESFGSGGAPLLPALKARVEQEFGVTVLEGYGCTESSAVIAAESLEECREQSVGKPLPHAEVAILDPEGTSLPAGQEGEICVRGPGVMLGYWNEPELTAETVVDGWLHTGDLGRLDEDGYLYVLDRAKDLIIRGGFNVFPRDVEDALLAHPDVTGAAVVGRPDEKSGEEVVAVVSLAEGAETGTEELTAFARERLARYKYPREVIVVDAVPVTSVGKVDRKAVRGIVGAQASRV
jgi:long-chain acyl-CoA synthetase